MICRYSSSATVACSLAIAVILAAMLRRSDGPPPVPTGGPAARPLGQEAARRGGVALRAEVGRLPYDRLPRRRSNPAPEPQRPADEPLLPGGARAGEEAAREAARARRGARGDRGWRAGVRPALAAHSPGGVPGGAPGERDPGPLRRLRPAGGGPQGSARAPIRRAPRAPSVGCPRAGRADPVHGGPY